MNLSNFHTHSEYCDGAGKPAEYVMEAIKQGFTSLGFSSHAPISFEKDWTLDENRIPEYLEEIGLLKNEYSDRIEIYRGLEIDYLENLSGPSSAKFQELKLDFIIGSVHMIPTIDGEKFLAIDGPTSHLKELLEKSFDGSMEKLSDRYYSLLRDMIGQGGFQILGHIDLVKKRNSGNAYFNESETWYREQVFQTLDTLAGTGIIMEVNTGGISRGAIDSVYPSSWILERAAELNIPLMLNADAHVPDHISFYYPEAMDIIRSAGYGELYSISGGEWVRSAI